MAFRRLMWCVGTRMDPENPTLVQNQLLLEPLLNPHVCLRCSQELVLPSEARSLYPELPLLKVLILSILGSGNTLSWSSYLGRHYPEQPGGSGRSWG